MAVFERNLTSRILSDGLAKILSTSVLPRTVCEIGCGDGNITVAALGSSCGDVSVIGIDISHDAIKAANKNWKLNSHFAHIPANFYVADSIKSFLGDKIQNPIFVVDVAAISESVAKLSAWYNGVPCETGASGLRLVTKYLDEIKTYMDSDHYKQCDIILPIIGLCNHDELVKFISRKFKDYSLSNRTEWPLPKELMQKLKEENVDLSKFYMSKKFGQTYTFTMLCHIKDPK